MDETTNSGNRIKRYIKRMQLIHLMLVAGMLLLGLFAFGLQKAPISDYPVQGQVYVYLIPISALIGYFGGIYVFDKLMASLRQEQALSLKLMRFQSASLLQYACLEAPALLALFAYIEQGYLLYAAIASFLLIYLMAIRPTKKRIRQKIPLTTMEQERLM